MANPHLAGRLEGATSDAAIDLDGIELRKSDGTNLVDDVNTLTEDAVTEDEIVVLKDADTLRASSAKAISHTTAQEIELDSGKSFPTNRDAVITFTIRNEDATGTKVPLSQSFHLSALLDKSEATAGQEMLVGDILPLTDVQIIDTDGTQDGYINLGYATVLGSRVFVITSTANLVLTRDISIAIEEDSKIYGGGDISDDGTNYRFPWKRGNNTGVDTLSRPQALQPSGRIIPPGVIWSQASVTIAAGDVNKAIADSSATQLPILDTPIHLWIGGLDAGNIRSSLIRVLPPVTAGTVLTGTNSRQIILNGVTYRIGHLANAMPVWSAGTAGTYASVELQVEARHTTERPSTTYLDYSYTFSASNQNQFLPAAPDRIVIPTTGTINFYETGNLLFEVDIASVRAKTASTVGTTATDANSVAVTHTSITYRFGHDATNHLLVAASYNTGNKSFVAKEKPEHYAPSVPEPPNVAFDENLAYAVNTDDIFRADPDSSPIEAGKNYDIYDGNRKIGNITAHELGNITEAAVGDTASSATAITIETDQGFAIDIGKYTKSGALHFMAALVSDDPTQKAIHVGKDVDLRLQTIPAVDVTSDNFKAYFDQEITKDPDVSESNGQVDYAWNTDALADGSVTTGKIASGAVTTDELGDGSVTNAKLDAATQSKVDKTDDIEGFALTTSTDQVSLAKTRLPTITEVASTTAIPTATGGVALYKFTADSGTYKENDIVLQTSTGLTLLYNEQVGFRIVGALPGATQRSNGDIILVNKDLPTATYVDPEGRTQTGIKSGTWLRYSSESSTWNAQEIPVQVAREYIFGNLDIIPRSKLPASVINDPDDSEVFNADRYKDGDLVSHLGDLYVVSAVPASRTRNAINISSYDSEVENHAFRFRQDGDDAVLEFRSDLDGVTTWDGLAAQGASIVVGGGFGSSPVRRFTRVNSELTTRFGYTYVTYRLASYTLPVIVANTLQATFVDANGNAINFLSEQIDGTLTGDKLLRESESAPASPFPANQAASNADEYHIQVVQRTNPRPAPFNAVFNAYQPRGSQFSSGFSHFSTAQAPWPFNHITFFGNSDRNGSYRNRYRFTQVRNGLDNFGITTIFLESDNPHRALRGFPVNRDSHGYYWTDVIPDDGYRVPSGGITWKIYGTNASARSIPETAGSSSARDFASDLLKPQLLVTLNESNHFGRFRNGNDNTWDRLALDTNPTRLRTNMYPDFGALLFRIYIPSRVGHVWSEPVPILQLNDLDDITTDARNRADFADSRQPHPVRDYLANEFYNFNWGDFNSIKFNLAGQCNLWMAHWAGTDYWTWATDHVASWSTNSEIKIYWMPQGIPHVRV